jgi:opacity protein-like surface antigen
MKKALLALPLLVLLASGAHAQSANYKGFSLALNASVVSPTTDYETAGKAVASDTSTGTVVSLQSRYYFPITEQYLVGLGLNKSLTRIRAGTLSGVESTLKDRVSIDISPAYALSDTTLLFGKVAFISGTFNSSSDDSNSTASGVGYGVGARYMVNKTFFLQGSFDTEQYNQVQFGATTQKVKASSFSVGVGAKF